MIVFHVGLQRLWSHYVKYTYNTHHPFHGQFILHMPNDTHGCMYVCAGNMMMHTQCLIYAKMLCAHSIRLAEWMPCRTMYMKVNHFLLCSLFANNTPNAAVWSFYYFVSLVLCFLLSAPSSAFCSVRARTILSWITLRMDTLLYINMCVHDVCVAKFCFTPSSFSTFCVCNDVQVLHILPKLLLAKCMFPLYLFTRAQSSCERAHSRIGLFRSPFNACVKSAFARLHHPNETVANVYTALGLP